MWSTIHFGAVLKNWARVEATLHKKSLNLFPGLNISKTLVQNLFNAVFFLDYIQNKKE